MTTDIFYQRYPLWVYWPEHTQGFTSCTIRINVPFRYFTAIRLIKMKQNLFTVWWYLYFYNVKFLCHKAWLIVLNSGDLPNTDQVVSVTCKQSLAICWPCKGDTVGRWSFASHADHIRSQLIHNGLALQIPNLDAWSCSRTEPVSVGAETQWIQNVTSIKRVQVFSLV